MKVCIIGGGGQVAEGIGAMLIQNNIDVFFYRAKRIFVKGTPIRPKRTQNRFDNIEIIGTKKTIIEEATFKYEWADESMLIKCEVFIFTMPSYTAEVIARSLSKYLSGKILINISDRFLGTFAMNQEILKAGYKTLGFGIALNSPPIVAYQPIRNGFTKVYYDKSSVNFSCLSNNYSSEAIQILKDVLKLPEKSIKMSSSMLGLAFENTQSIVHSVQDLENLLLGNYGVNGIGSRYDKCSYTDMMVKNINEIIVERDEVSHYYLGLKFKSLADYDIASNKKFKTGLSIEYGTALYRQEHNILNTVPRPSIYYAHGYEDIGWSMVPLESFAKKAGIKTPNLSKLIDRWSFFMSNDYRANGRTIESLGLSDINNFIKIND